MSSIKETAEKIVRDIQDDPHGVVFKSTRAFQSPADTAKSLADAIQKALRDERERAAKIAETYLSDYRNLLTPSAVAAAIRKED